MSEDEGQNPTAQGVSAADEADADDGVEADSSAGVDEERDEAAVDETPGPDAETGDDDRTESAESADPEEPVAAEGNVAEPDPAETSPQTSEEIQELLDALQEYDDEIARDVTAIVEMARDLNGTVQNQRAELEDLSERVEAQAETIGELQTKLDDREQELEARSEIIDEYEEQIEDLKGHVKRTQADFQNYKKRAKKRQEQMKARATEDLVSRLVGVRDNMKRALAEESDDVESLRDGLEMTLREFDRILAEENVEEIDPEPGTEVDPQRHEVMVQVDSGQPEGTIADVFTPGYEMGEKVIQNAQVTVSNGALEEPNDEDAGDDERESEGTNGDSSADERETDAGGVGDEPDASDDQPADSTAADDEDGDTSVTDDEGGDTSVTDDEGGDDGGDAIELGGEVASADDFDGGATTDTDDDEAEATEEPTETGDEDTTGTGTDTGEGDDAGDDETSETTQ